MVNYVALILNKPNRDSPKKSLIRRSEVYLEISLKFEPKEYHSFVIVWIF